MDYKKAGVDIEAGYRSVELMKEHVKRTMRRSTRWTGRLFGRIFSGEDQRDGGAGASFRYRWLRHEGEAGISSG